MKKKMLIAGISCLSVVLVTVACTMFYMKNKTTEITQTQNKPAAEIIKQTTPAEKPVTVPVDIKNKSDLSYYTKYDIPFVSISDMTKFPAEMKTAVETILENNPNVYLLKYNPSEEEAVIILRKSAEEGNKYSRHLLEFIQINKDGEIKNAKTIYEGDEGETSNAIAQTDDVWEFDTTGEISRPTKHVSFNEKGKIEFTEIWNYSGNEPVKYEMRNAKDKTVSILKETQKGDTEYNVEHIFYDNNGKTTMSLSVNYDGANIKHLSFYDSKHPENTIVVESEYTEGNKTGEKIYNQDFEQINNFKAIYTDGELSEIEEVKETQEEAQATAENSEEGT